jgi:hypothetical protein
MIEGMTDRIEKCSCGPYGCPDNYALAPPLGQAPSFLGQAPSFLGQAPGEPGRAPDEPGQAPSFLGQAPSFLGQAPDEPGQALDEPGQAPDEPGQAPDEPGQAPDELDQKEHLFGGDQEGEDDPLSAFRAAAKSQAKGLPEAESDPLLEAHMQACRIMLANSDPPARDYRKAHVAMSSATLKIKETLMGARCVLENVHLLSQTANALATSDRPRGYERMSPSECFDRLSAQLALQAKEIESCVEALVDAGRSLSLARFNM